MKSESLPRLPKSLWSSYAKAIVFFLEIALIASLIILWFSWESVRKSKSLSVLFFYCFPSEFLVAIVPHEPVLLYFAKFYSPLTIALVSAAGTILTEVINYSVFRYVADLGMFKKMLQSKAVVRVVALFDRAPFFALWIAGFTPIPFYPFRFLVVLSRYPLPKYILAVFTSRTPRFFILALIGHEIRISDQLLAVLFVILILSVNIPLIKKILKKMNRRKRNATLTLPIENTANGKLALGKDERNNP